MSVLNKVFGRNARLLRRSHHLSQPEMAELAGFLSRSSVSLLETGVNAASYPVLVNLVNTFSVSPSWLMGLASEPYSAEQLLLAENDVFGFLARFSAYGIELLDLFFLPLRYQDPLGRAKCYSLSVRADILFLLHVLITDRLYALAGSERLSKLPDDALLEFRTLVFPKSPRGDFYASQSRFEKYLIELNGLANSDGDTPLFAISR